MKFSKNWKRFWNLSRRSEGFTLVELIVVIAILAILAGVATAGYSGYIKKANEAADLDTLYAINTAFAAACIENNTDATLIDAAAIGMDGNLTKVGNMDATKLAAFNTSFDKFFGTDAINFKTITGLLFDAKKHQFVDAKSENISVAYGNGYVTVSGEVGQMLADSTWGTAEGLGAPGLLNKVNEVAGFAQLLVDSGDSNAFVELVGGTDFLYAMGTYIGAEVTDTMTAEQMEELIVAQMEIMESEGKDVSMVTSNAAVLFAAQNAGNQNADDFMTLLKSDDAKQQIASNADSGAMLSQAALAYGMYTAYAYSTGDQDLINSTSNPSDILDNLNDEDFQKYLETDQADADLKAYMAALNTVSDAAGDTGAAQQVVVEGFTDQELVDLLTALMG